MKTLSNRTTGRRALLTLALSSLLTLCACGALDDDTQECQATYKVRFRYDMNMKYANAFEHEVRAVTLYVIDTEGNIVRTEEADAAELDATDGTITLRGLQPGTYSFLAWCTTNANNTYEFSDGQTPTEMTDLTCRLKPSRNRAGEDEVDFDIDALYHGLVPEQVLPDSFGTFTYDVPLTKDTNRFRIVLQNISNKTLLPSQFAFELTDDNEYLDYDNSVIAEEDDDTPVAYKPWNTSSALINGEEAAVVAAAADDDDLSTPQTGFDANSVIVELTTSRLMADHAPRLSVTNTETGETIINLPLLDYIRLVMGYENRNMDLQEYLDRQDEYNMVFFIDERDTWTKAYIYINSWRVVLMEKTL
jgi:hypothetical protein